MTEGEKRLDEAAKLQQQKVTGSQEDRRVEFCQVGITHQREKGLKAGAGHCPDVAMPCLLQKLQGCTDQIFSTAFSSILGINFPKWE